MKKNYLLIFAIILNTTLAFANNDLSKKVSSASEDYISSHFMNGVYMFCDDKGVLHEGANGFGSIKNKKDLEVNQQMPIASATKTMTAAGILRLQDKGLLNVQNTIATYLDAKSGIWDNNIVPNWAKQVTIHNLLTHRSGLAEYFMNIELDIKKSHKDLTKDIVNFASKNQLKSKPGEEYNYVNTNYVLLGAIIEQVSGVNLAEFYQNEFFIPLGMKDTKLITIAEAVQQQTNPDSMEVPSRYFVTPTGSQPQINDAQSEFLMIPFADGGVASTVKDLTLWLQALHVGKVLSNESYNLMTTKHYEIDCLPGIKSNYMGYGLYISELETGDVLYHHPGKAVAIRSESGCIPKKNICFATLSNVMDYIPKEMQDKVDLTKEENKLDIRHYIYHVLHSIFKD